MEEPRVFLRRLFEAAVSAAQPEVCVDSGLPDPPNAGRIVVVGAGKASAAMARAVERIWSRPLEGLVITRYGHAVPCEQIEIVEAAHPVPDSTGMEATARMLGLVEGLAKEDLVLCLISGGGSSLLVQPGEGLTLDQKQELNAALLRSGATITEMNCLRRHLSEVKGGRLAAACHPARVHTLLISDVPGDREIDIASGPTVGDPTTCADALAIARRYNIALPHAAERLLGTGAGESVKPDDPRLESATSQLIAAPQLSLEAAAKVARAAGVEAHILGDAIEGEARAVGTVMAGLARQIAMRGQPFGAPCMLLSGGETTVSVRGDGKGGRNVEFLLSLALSLDGLPGVYAMAGDTDGVDGSEEVAGAVIGPDTLDRCAALGLSARSCLERNDAHTFFKQLGDQIVTGPTMTNVNDFRAILILPW